MPTYSYFCDKCGDLFDRVVPLALRANKQGCPVCQSEPPSATQVATPTNFVLRGDGWVGKNVRIRGQMETKNRSLGMGSERVAPIGGKLVPNVGGQEVGSWAEQREVLKTQQAREALQ